MVDPSQQHHPAIKVRIERLIVSRDDIATIIFSDGSAAPLFLIVGATSGLAALGG